MGYIDLIWVKKRFMDGSFYWNYYDKSALIFRHQKKDWLLNVIFVRKKGTSVFTDLHYACFSLSSFSIFDAGTPLHSSYI